MIAEMDPRLFDKAFLIALLCAEEPQGPPKDRPLFLEEIYKGITWPPLPDVDWNEEYFRVIMKDLVREGEFVEVEGGVVHKSWSVRIEGENDASM